MSLIACGSIHQGHERFSDDSRGRQDIFLCLAALLCEQFLSIRKQEVPRYRSSPTSWRLFFLSVFSSGVVLEKNAFIRSKLPTAAC